MPSKQQQYLDNCLKKNDIAGFFKAIDKWEIVPEYRLNEYNTLKAKFKHNPPYNFDQMLGVFALDLSYNTHFDNEIQLETTKNQQNMGNSATVNGNDNIVIQGGNGGTVNVGATPTPNHPTTPNQEPKKGWDWKWWVGSILVPILLSSPWWIPYLFPSTKTKTIKGILALPKDVKNVSTVYLKLPSGGSIDEKVDGKGKFQFDDITVPNNTTSFEFYIELGDERKYGRENINPNDLKNDVLDLGEVEIETK